MTKYKQLAVPKLSPAMKKRLREIASDPAKARASGRDRAGWLLRDVLNQTEQALHARGLIETLKFENIPFRDQPPLLLSPTEVGRAYVLSKKMGLTAADIHRAQREVHSTHMRIQRGFWEEAAVGARERRDKARDQLREEEAALSRLQARVDEATQFLTANEEDEEE